MHAALLTIAPELLLLLRLLGLLVATATTCRPAPPPLAAAPGPLLLQVTVGVLAAAQGSGNNIIRRVGGQELTCTTPGYGLDSGSTIQSKRGTAANLL